MTRTPQPPARSMSRLRRIAVVSAVAGAALALQVSDGADAARRTKSDVVAAEAGRALEALDAWQQTRNPADYVSFVRSREQTAMLTADDLEIDATTLRRSWSDAPVEKQHALLAAMSQLGVPYRSIASEPGVGFDCSGLTIWAFAEAGVEIPRVSGDQISAADAVDLETAEPGDLVYYPGHIGIYLGAEVYVHSPETGSHVEAVHLPDKSLRFGDAVEQG